MEFSTDKQRSMTVILGNNATGKSTLIQAFMWALYNKIELENPNDILNKDVIREMYSGKKESVSVTVKLVHENIEYTVKKEQIYECRDVGSVRRIEDIPIRIWFMDGVETRSVKTPLTIRDKILPHDLSDYFFFDGEHIKKLLDVRKKGGLEEAISKIMALTPLKEAVKHLRKVQSEFATAIVSDGGDAGSIEDQKRAFNKAEGERDLMAERKEKAQKLNETYDGDYQSALHDFDRVKGVINTENSLTKKDEDLTAKKRQLQNEQSYVSKTFSNVFFNVLAKPMILESSRFVESFKEKGGAGEGIPEMHSVSIDYLLERGYCICGTPLKDQKHLVSHLQKEKNLLPPESIGTQIRVFLSTAREKVEKASSDAYSFERSYEVVSGRREDIYDIEREMEELKAELVSHSKSDIEETKKKLYTAEELRKQSRSQLISAEADLVTAERNLAIAKRELETRAMRSEKNRLPLLGKEYAYQLEQQIAKTVGIKQNSMRKDFSEKLQEVFNEMYHGKREVVVSENYDVQLLTDKGEETSKSTGTNVVLSVAFVSTLLRLARENMSRDPNEDNIITEPYPLVMDAPSSELDTKHISNVFGYIPKVAEQTILFTMEKDWKHAKDAVGDRVGKMYIINKHSETYSSLQEVSKDV